MEAEIKVTEQHTTVLTLTIIGPALEEASKAASRAALDYVHGSPAAQTVGTPRLLFFRWERFGTQFKRVHRFKVIVGYDESEVD